LSIAVVWAAFWRPWRDYGRRLAAADFHPFSPLDELEAAHVEPGVEARPVER
jgi:hypothetical protein